MYLLTFPLYPELIERVEEITLIVKGTLVDPNLPRHLDNPFDPETRADMPATFQVIEMNQEGVLVWITQPVLRFDHLLAVVREEMQFPDDFNVLHFAPTPRPFMVEISAFGPLGLDSAPRVARVNLNTATETELRSLPRIGPALARRILELREAQGGFTAVTDLRDVSGIDNFLVSRLAHLVTL
ncbi:MAG: helix-hairpin-helix domain-containing protein [Ardenticatenaceae bacterium]|nr:helix-hairpin-helix domain-containing protein [Ardenticatenaceae bacterium]